MTTQDKNETHVIRGWMAFKRQHVNPSSYPIADYLAAHRARYDIGYTEANFEAIEKRDAALNLATTPHP